MMHFIFSTQPAAPFSFITLLSTSRFCSILLYLSPPPPSLPLCPLPPNLWLSNFPFISCLIFLSRCVCLLLACSCDVFRQRMKLPTWGHSSRTEGSKQLGGRLQALWRVEGGGWRGRGLHTLESERKTWQYGMRGRILSQITECTRVAVTHWWRGDVRRRGHVSKDL